MKFISAHIDPAVRFEVCGDDPGIIFSDDMRAGKLIGLAGIKLVHVRRAPPHYSKTFEWACTERFLSSLEDNLNHLIKGKPEFVDLPFDQQIVLRQIFYDSQNLDRSLKALGFKVKEFPQIHTTFNSKSLCDGYSTPWHYDQRQPYTVSRTFFREGVEYLIGQMTEEEALKIYDEEATVPSHVKIGQAMTGDVLFMTGYEGARSKHMEEVLPNQVLNECCYHRTPSVRMRAAQTYGFSLPALG